MVGMWFFLPDIFEFYNDPYSRYTSFPYFTFSGYIGGTYQVFSSAVSDLRKLVYGSMIERIASMNAPVISSNLQFSVAHPLFGVEFSYLGFGKKLKSYEKTSLLGGEVRRFFSEDKFRLFAYYRSRFSKRFRGAFFISGESLLRNYREDDGNPFTSDFSKASFSGGGAGGIAISYAVNGKEVFNVPVHMGLDVLLGWEYFSQYAFSLENESEDSQKIDAAFSDEEDLVTNSTLPISLPYFHVVPSLTFPFMFRFLRTPIWVKLYGYFSRASFSNALLGGFSVKTGRTIEVSFNVGKSFSWIEASVRPFSPLLLRMRVSTDYEGYVLWAGLTLNYSTLGMPYPLGR